MIQRLILLFSLFFFVLNWAQAVETPTEIEDTSVQEQLQNLLIEYPEQIYKDDVLNLSVENLKNDLGLFYPDETFRFEWNIRGANSREWEEIELKFEEAGEKYIVLNIFRESGELLKSQELEVLVYSTSVPLIIQESFRTQQIDIFERNAEVQWIYFYTSGIEKEKIEEINILSVIENYRRINGEKSDYLTIWGDREFSASIISKLGSELSANGSNMKFKVFVISPFNLQLLENYLKNFIVEKPWLEKIVLTNEEGKFQTHKAPLSIELLQKNLQENGFEYTDINIEESWINAFFFISKFINNLSNNSYTSEWIYLIILIPFLFTLLVILKHLIWLSPIWVLVPIGFTLMIFKIGLLASFLFMLIFILLNVVLARIVNTQTLLYTPKISFLLIINIVFAILVTNLLSEYGIADLSLWNSLFIIIYIIILEKLINVILSKEFNEYRQALMNSLFIWLIWYLIFSSETITSFILSYPETILILIPINFFIWKFSGLRVTEYFRFREVIRSVEEE